MFVCGDNENIFVCQIIQSEITTKMQKRLGNQDLEFIANLRVKLNERVVSVILYDSATRNLLKMTADDYICLDKGELFDLEMNISSLLIALKLSPGTDYDQFVADSVTLLN